MSQLPGPPSQLPSPPAYAYEPTYDPASPERPSQNLRPAGQPGRRGILGWLTAVGLFLLGYAKYAFLLFKAVPALLTVTTLLISFGAYFLWQGPAFAAALVVMLFIHEMGHVIEIRRQGLEATAPVFIPFLGAAIFQRSHPQDALRQAQIGIAGPIAGTLGATAALLLYPYLHWQVLVLAATLGFFLNLINLIPIGMLDGGWIMAPVSKWFQVVGGLLLLGSVFIIGFSPILILILVLGLPTIISRFRNADSPYFKAVPPLARFALGASWLGLVIYLGGALVFSQQILVAILRASGQLG